MDLPTYTNIWRIEKRLYKLYDLRLPMPLPLVQIGVFVGVFVPWILLLRFIGIPFQSPWHVLYLVPPGVLTWLATRPVIEGKRLTELLLSQTRYLTEPRTWCRLTPIREPREVVVVARVWRQAGPARPVTAAEKAAVKAGRKTREARRKKGRGRRAGSAPAHVPAPARAAARTTGTALAAFAPDRPALAAAPRALEQYAARATPGEQAGTAPPAAGGGRTRATALGADAPRPAAPATSETRASFAPASRRSEGRRAASAWRPTTRRNISHEPEPALDPLPAAEAGTVREPAPAEPPPATPRLEVPPPPGGPATGRIERTGPAEPAAHAPGAAAAAAGGTVSAEPGGDQASARPPVGSGKRALASGVRRPGAAAEFWRAIAPPEGAGPAEGAPASAEQAPSGDERASAEQARAKDGGGAEPEAGEREAAEPSAPVAPTASTTPATTATAPTGGDAVTEDPATGGQRGTEATGTAEPTGRTESTEPPAPAVTTRPDIPKIPAATTRPDIPAVPGAFGATGAPTGRETPAEEAEPAPAGERPVKPAEQQPASASPTTAVPAEDRPRAADAPVGEQVEKDRGPVAAEGRDAPAAGEPAGRGREAGKEPPKPWSSGLSRPLRGPDGDARVWPPPRLPQGGPPAQPRRGTPPRRPAEPGPGRGGAPARASGAPGAPPAAQQPPAGPPAKMPGYPAAAVPPAGPGAEPPTETPAPRQAPHVPPARPGQAPHQPWPPAAQPPPPAAPDAPGRTSWRPTMPEPSPVAQPQAYAPPRDVRSGPASPVRPRPLPPPPSPPAPPQAITPPDPEHENTTGGLRRLIKAVGGGHSHVDDEYEERLQRPFHGTRRIVVLGCTGGAGQTVTTLMLGHTFAQYCGEPVVAIDVNPGPGALARRTRSETNETLTGLITRSDQVNTLTAMRRYTSQAKSGLDVITAGKNPLQALDDRDYALAIRTVDRFYSITMLDAAAAVVARVLPHADQIVLVAPASADAPRAVAMTFEWLDGHGYDQSRSHAVTVINGVSRRSMDDVEQAEAVARGRCRALVRIPWDDHLSLDRSPRNELKSLRAPTRRAYLALAGVVAGGFAALPERYQQQEASR